MPNAIGRLSDDARSILKLEGQILENFIIVEQYNPVFDNLTCLLRADTLAYCTLKYSIHAYLYVLNS